MAVFLGRPLHSSQRKEWHTYPLKEIHRHSNTPISPTPMNQQNNSGPSAGQVNTQTQVQFHSTAVHFPPATHTWSHLRTSRTPLMPSSAGWEAGQSASLADHKNTCFRQFPLSEPLQQRTSASLNCQHYLSVGYYYTLVGSIASS